MKKIYLFLLSTILLMTSALAESITVVPGGKPGGSSFARATMYKEVLTKMGHDVKFENISSTKEGAKYLEKTRGKETVIMMYPTNQPSQIGYDITENNFVLKEYFAPYFWCQSNEAVDKDVLKVGLDKNMNQKFSDKLFGTLGKEVIYLRYKNSGALYNAITAGDIDAMFTNQGKSLKLVKNNQGSCIANTSSEVIHDIPSVYTIVKDGTKFPVMEYPVISNNTSEKLRSILIEANKDELFVQWRASKGLPEIVGQDTRQEELRLAMEGQELWKQ